MKMTHIQSVLTTNHLCLKHEFPISVLTRIIASGFFLRKTHNLLKCCFDLFIFMSLIRCYFVCIFLDLIAYFGRNIYGPGKHLRTVVK